MSVWDHIHQERRDRFHRKANGRPGMEGEQEKRDRWARRATGLKDAPQEQPPTKTIQLHEHTCSRCDHHVWIQPGLESMACECGALAWVKRTD